MTLNEAAAFLLENDSYIILTHKRPDGDTLGSAAGLCLGLRSLGKTAYLAPNPEAIGRYARFVKHLEAPDGYTPGTVVAVDTASAGLLPGAFAVYAENVALSVDHHISGGAFARNALIDASCAATGELVAMLLCEMGVSVTPEIAEPLYLAIVTDTGCLRQENTTARALRITADLLDTGINTAPINSEFFEIKTLPRLALEAALFEDIEVLCGGRVSIVFLTLDKIEKTKATYDDTDNISGLARTIAGVEVGITLREEHDGTVKISLRTKSNFMANEICARLGGGGHQRAAGCTVAGNVGHARQEIINALFAANPELAST